MMANSKEPRLADGEPRIEPPGGLGPDPQSENRDPRSTVSPWVVAIIVGLGLVISFNIFYAYTAISGADPIDPAYVTQPR
jgi:hypothetical protein